MILSDMIYTIKVNETTYHFYSRDLETAKAEALEKAKNDGIKEPVIKSAFHSPLDY